VRVPVVVANLVVLPDRVPTVGATPGPPPIIGRFAISAPLEVQVEALSKYGMPPLVPATVSAKVPLVVMGDPDTEISPPVKDCPTLVTVPVADGAAHAPSPLQNVEEEAPVPLFRLATGRFPLTSEARLMTFQIGAAEMVPFPVWLKNFRVVVVFPANRVATPADAP
jgi:hypothetical protein